MNSGLVVKTLMTAKGVSQTELARRLGLKQAAVSKRLRTGDMTIGMVLDMLDKIGVDAKLVLECADGMRFEFDDKPKSSLRGKIKKGRKKGKVEVAPSESEFELDELDEILGDEEEKVVVEPKKEKVVVEQEDDEEDEDDEDIWG